ncbi:MAG: DUF937 domain-containing protein [Leptolyngbya sp. SIO3F4]|nr:DUF937 domain-containing protein [Leptolyngbya sp. SIO3F4]
MFFEVLSAINDPNQQASVGQLEQVTKSVQQLASGNGINSNQMQSMMTILGAALQPILIQKQSQLGAGELVSMLGRSNDSSVLTSIISPQIQQQLIQTITQKTGIQSSIAQVILPKLLPVVIDLFNMGSPTSGSVGSTNPLLSAFLDSNHAKNTDLGNVVEFAGRFLNTPN